MIRLKKAQGQQYDATKCHQAEFGQNLPVRITFQILLGVRPEIELSGRYSAGKLMTPLPQSRRCC